jgi:hypothetical protein
MCGGVFLPVRATFGVDNREITVMKNKIFYFDHSEQTREDVAPKIRQAISNIGNGYEVDMCPYHEDITAAQDKTLKEAKVAIVHIDDNFNKLIENSVADSVRLWVSTQGSGGRRAHQQKNKDGKYVDCIFLRPSHWALKINDWQAILTAITTPETVNAIMNANNVPPSLYPYFGEPTKGESMALSILCLGYLAAWASSQDYDEAALNQIIAEDNKDEIKNLLREFQKLPDHQTMMKTQFINSSGGVQGSSYWKVFGSNAREVLAVEAENCGMKSDAVFTTVLKLAEKIDNDEVISDPMLVAKAYLEIKAQEKNLAL